MNKKNNQPVPLGYECGFEFDINKILIKTYVIIDVYYLFIKRNPYYLVIYDWKLSLRVNIYLKLIINQKCTFLYHKVFIHRFYDNLCTIGFRIFRNDKENICPLV